jgi:N-acetylglucosamine-6-phosphate deacetylase
VRTGLPRFGVTAFLATIITSPLEAYGPCLDHLASAMGASGAGSRLLGVHLEGPFISPREPGTHQPGSIQSPSIALADEWLARGPIRLMTLAPELPGAPELARHLASSGVVVSMGHTSATWDEAAEGAAAGIRMGTHLFNAMPPLHHRRLGVVGFLLESDLSVSIIADGVHLDLRMAELVSRMKSPDQLILVTDALAGLGMPPGRFTLAGIEIVSDGTTGERLDGTLSGSVLPMDSALANLVRAGVAPEVAVRAATLNPARVLALEAQMGAVAVGRTADLVIFDDAWRTQATVIEGRVAFIAEQGGRAVSGLATKATEL